MDESFDAMVHELGEHLGPSLEDVLSVFQIQLPAGTTGAQLIREFMEGRPNLAADPGFVAWLGVHLAGAHPDGPFHPEVEKELRVRLEARAGGGEASA